MKYILVLVTQKHVAFKYPSVYYLILLFIFNTIELKE